MHAYITLLSTPGYLPGVLCLARSLRATGAAHPLVVALSAGIGADAQAALEREGLACLRLPAASPLPRVPQQGGHHWGNTFDKLHLFGLTQFERLVYLDSDMLVLAGIDELFNQPHMAAVAAGRAMHPEWVGLNSGLMVIEPRTGLPQAIGATLDAVLREHAARPRQAIGDQDLINAYYSRWPATRPLQLDEGYNMFHEYLGRYIAQAGYGLPAAPAAGAVPAGAPKPVKVVHFIGPVKPWHGKAVLRHIKRRVLGHAGAAEVATFRQYRGLLNG